MQRSWIVLFLCCFILTPLYVFASPILKLIGQPDDVAEMSGLAAVWMHDSVALQLRVSVPVAEVSAEPDEGPGDCLRFLRGSCRQHFNWLALHFRARLRASRRRGGA